ncbi:MAG: hypothetical protein IT376_08485 [Polyangiaceae bacterium]|nr:hypothetical protein [Polyangiaceae bacterium]
MPTLRTLAWAALVAVACTPTEETGDVIDSRRGTYQPPGSGAAVGEDAACSAIVAAEDQQSTKLHCGALTRAACPGYIRPAGGDCFDYDQATVDACVAYIFEYDRCTDFEQRRCILTAIPRASCGGAGAGGGGGASGADSGVDAAAGASGASGAGGTSGASGASGAGGTSGAGGGVSGSGGGGASDAGADASAGAGGQSGASGSGGASGAAGSAGAADAGADT